MALECTKLPSSLQLSLTCTTCYPPRLCYFSLTPRWAGIVVTPKSGLGETVVLTAWTRVLRLKPFEPEAAAAFIDAFRGRGPERPVR